MIHVFVGPTLSRSDPELAVPGVRVRPPARHGDLFDAAVRAGDTVVIVDGVYHQAPALRHKEILAALGRGVMVIGAASIGALRAAELAQFGMLGIGSVYAAYARGEIEGDDEVAVGQVPDGEFGALTWPLVNLRYVLELAASAGVLDGPQAAALLAAWRAVFYPQRTTAAVRAVCRRQGVPEVERWLAEQRALDGHFGDLKRADALAAVRHARGLALGDSADRAPTPPAPAVWESAYFRRWSNAFACTVVDGLELSTEDRLLYQQVFDPAYGQRWAAFLEHRSLHPCDGTVGVALAVRLVRASGADLDADRIFHPPVDLRDEQAVALLLAGETAMDRQAVARYADALRAERRTRPGFTVAAVRDDLVRRLLMRLWHCPEQGLDAQASARGLVCWARAVEAVKRLVPGLLEEMAAMAAGTEADHGGR
ncbi:TfuA-like protein [Streptomyces mauvecolor]